MRKMLFILGMLVHWASISFSQEIIGLSDGFDFNLNCNNLQEYNVVRTDQEGKVVWTLSFFNQYQPFDSSQFSYVVFGHSSIKNGKITSDPSEYDYWLIKKNEEQEFSIYPNPSIGFINIYTNFIDDKTNYEIIDGMNRVIFLAKINDITTNLDLSKQSKGIYFLKIYNNEKILKFEKICLN